MLYVPEDFISKYIFSDHFYELVPDMVLVMISEVLVDWVKHAFITKFNNIPDEVYKVVLILWYD